MHASSSVAIQNNMTRISTLEERLKLTNEKVNKHMKIWAILNVYVSHFLLLVCIYVFITNLPMLCAQMISNPCRQS